MKNTLLRRGLICLVALLVAVIPLASCKPQSNNGQNTDKEVIALITQSLSDYTVVRPDTTSAAVRQATADLSSAISKATGCSLPLGTDWVNHGESAPADTPEILVGLTNRQESIDALAGTRTNDYVLGAYGSKLVVGSVSDSGTLRAAIKLLSNFIYEQGNKYEVAYGKVQTFTFNSGSNEVSIGRYSYSKCVMMNARIDSYAIIYPKNDETAVSSTLANSLRDYISREAGYELPVYKDTRAYADYEILVGNTLRTSGVTSRKLAKDEYYISLVPVERTREDGTKVPGATLYVLFGEDAAEAVLTAFKKQFLPALTEMGEYVQNEAKTVTNMK